MRTRNNRVIHHDKHFLLNEDSPFILTESFRNMMSNISFAVPKKQEGVGKLICISSATVGEGKSTISSNLALTFANAGSKTVLIDCDMRKPKIKSIYKLPKNKGLVDYLSGQASFDEILQKDVRKNLDIIATYKTAPNPPALYNSGDFDEMLDKLSKEYEYVIIDTPPVNVVSDGVLVAAKTDGVVLVTRPYISDHKSIQLAINAISFAGAEFLGFVMNDIQQKIKNKKYYYNKYYKYGYGYGESKTEKEEKNSTAE